LKGKDWTKRAFGFLLAVTLVFFIEKVLVGSCWLGAIVMVPDLHLHDLHDFIDPNPTITNALIHPEATIKAHNPSRLENKNINFPLKNPKQNLTRFQRRSRSQKPHPVPSPITPTPVLEST
jgi:hypothetical protein